MKPNEETVIQEEVPVNQNLWNRMVNMPSQTLQHMVKRRRPRRPWVLVVVLAVVIGLFFVAWVSVGGTPGEIQEIPTYTVARETMRIEVTEGGSIKAQNPVEIKSEVEGRTTIVSVVPEGTIITAEDVAQGKVLIELDSSEIKEKLTQQEITCYSAEASFTEAQKSYDIQVKQNESDIQTAELKLKFARMDLQKYLGDTTGVGLVARSGDPNLPLNLALLISDPNLLGGESLQKWRELNNKIDLAREESKQSESKFGWTTKLFAKDYVTRTDYEKDELEVRRKGIDVKQAEMNLDLFIRYEFPKETEKRYSDYLEGQRALDRTRQQTEAKLAQAEARFKSAEAQNRLQKDRLEKLQKQKRACVIRAPVPGLVVYYKEQRWDNRRIEVGAEVRERQNFMSLPNAAQMAVEVKVHETLMSKIQPQQTARIAVDAFPEQVFTGKVIKISQLPDQQQWFMNPDLKVYAAEVSIDGAYDFLKSGMSAKVNILVEELPDVLKVPVQAVVTRQGEKVCYVMTAAGPQMTPVQTGAFDESFIQITGGLAEGQKVLLAPPRFFEAKSTETPAPAPEPNGPAA